MNRRVPSVGKEMRWFAGAVPKRSRLGAEEERMLADGRPFSGMVDLTPSQANICLQIGVESNSD